MPFQSAAQRRYCFAQMRRDLQAGRKPKWDCHAFHRNLPSTAKSRARSRSRSRSPKRSSSRKRNTSRPRKSDYMKVSRTQTGPRGGRYKFVWSPSIQDYRKIYL